MTDTPLHVLQLDPSLLFLKIAHMASMHWPHQHFDLLGFLASSPQQSISGRVIKPKSNWVGSWLVRRQIVVQCSMYLRLDWQFAGDVYPAKINLLKFDKNRGPVRPLGGLSSQSLKDFCPNDRTYRKIPKINPGAYIFQRPLLRGLFLEGLMFRGAYLWRETSTYFHISWKLHTWLVCTDLTNTLISWAF